MTLVLAVALLASRSRRLPPRKFGAPAQHTVHRYFVPFEWYGVGFFEGVDSPCSSAWQGKSRVKYTPEEIKNASDLLSGQRKLSKKEALLRVAKPLGDSRT